MNLNVVFNNKLFYTLLFMSANALHPNQPKTSEFFPPVGQDRDTIKFIQFGQGHLAQRYAVSRTPNIAHRFKTAAMTPNDQLCTQWKNRKKRAWKATSYIWGVYSALQIATTLNQFNKPKSLDEELIQSFQDSNTQSSSTSFSLKMLNIPIISLCISGICWARYAMIKQHKKDMRQLHNLMQHEETISPNKHFSQHYRVPIAPPSLVGSAFKALNQEHAQTKQLQRRNRQQLGHLPEPNYVQRKYEKLREIPKPYMFVNNKWVEVERSPLSCTGWSA